MKIARIAMAFAVTVLRAHSAGSAAQRSNRPRRLRRAMLCWCMGPGPTAPAGPKLFPTSGRGLKVTAVQNPLTSLADSVAATRRALALQDGPTVLVAHSWAARHQRNGDRSEGHGAGLCCRAGPGRRRGFRRALRKVSRRAGARRRSGTRRFHHDFRTSPISSIISPMASSPKRQRCFMPCRSPRPPPCSANEPQRPRGTQSVMVCGLDARSDD